MHNKNPPKPSPTSHRNTGILGQTYITCPPRDWPCITRRISVQEYLPCIPPAPTCCSLHRTHRGQRDGLNASPKQQYDRARVGTCCRWKALESSKSQCHSKCWGWSQKPREQSNQWQPQTYTKPLQKTDNLRHMGSRDHGLKFGRHP